MHLKTLEYCNSCEDDFLMCPFTHGMQQYMDLRSPPLAWTHYGRPDVRIVGNLIADLLCPRGAF